ncbi:MAG: DsbA family protein [Thiogranum sp.]|nr:DsbA family protein [Thiogranum sp.]
MEIKPLLKVTVFSDYICPYCYIGWLRLEKLRNHYDLRVNWCMTEIHADNPPEGRPPTELGYSSEQWGRMVSDLDELAAEEGVHFGGLHCTTNSHRALLLAEAAKEQGPDIFYNLHRRLFEVYLCEGRNLADEAVLRELIDTLGADPDLPDRAWSDPRYEQRLREYALAARELGVDSTPTFYFDSQPLRGVQATETLLTAARAALSHPMA